MFYGVDIGGQNIRVGVKEGKKLKKLSSKTSFVFSETIKEIGQMINALGARPTAIGIGSPGPLDWRKGIVLKTPNLPWVNVSFSDLGKRFNCPVYLDNDANLAGLGEAKFGAGSGFENVAGFTLGTGIGNFLIRNGEIIHGSLDIEGGHQILDPSGPLCNCGQRGCLEGYISSTAIGRKYHQEPAKIKDPKIWKEISYYLAWGIANLILITSPDVIILAGGMIKRGKILLGPTVKYLAGFVKIVPIPPVKPASLGEDAGIYGAITLAEKRYLK